MNILEATTFLSESAEADSNLEETAVNVAKMVNDAYDDVELADAASDAIEEPLSIIDPVVTIGAQIPVPPCTDLKPAAPVISNMQKLVKNKIKPAIKKIKRCLGAFATITGPMLPATGHLMSRVDINQHAHDAKSVTEKLMKTFPDELPNDLKEEAERIVDAANRAEAVLKTPLQEVDDILVGLHKLNPLMNLTNGFKGIHDALNPVITPLGKASKSFGHFLQPFKKGLDRITHAKSFELNKIESAIEGKINELLHKLGVKGDIFKAVKGEIQKAETKVTDLFWKPISQVADEVENKLVKEEQKVEAAVNSYFHLRDKLDTVLTPLDDLLVAYIQTAAKHGVKPS